MTTSHEAPDPRGTALSLRLGFTGVLVAAFGGLLLFAALAPGAMTMPIVAGIPLSICLAVLVIFCAVGTTGLYVLLASRREQR